MGYLLPWFLLSGDPSRYSCRTTVNYRLCLSSLAGCRFGRSGSGGFVDGSAVSLTGFEDEGRFAVEADVKKLFEFF